MQYYEINEQTARRANDVNSMSDYTPGSATAVYRAAVDKAAALVDERKAKISPYYHDKLDALLDRYARRLADYYNAYYRNESACPSILVCGGGNFPVNKKRKQNARRDSLWQEYKEMQVITSPQFLHLLPSSRGHMMINASASSSISLILSAWVKTTSGQYFFRASWQALPP